MVQKVMTESEELGYFNGIEKNLLVLLKTHTETDVTQTEIYRIFSHTKYYYFGDLMV